MGLLLFVLFVKIAFGDKVVRIKGANGFIEFSNDVNRGTNYSGTTVLLDSDLSLSDKALEPIGNSSSYHFRGVFDGQGHIISDLKMNSSSGYTGVFGYSEGLTIKNVVIDSSCSLTNTYDGSAHIHVGGIVGDCYTRSVQCNIENNVNMADVTFSGNINSVLCLGGIVGVLESSYDNVYVKNCVNYGSVTYSGAVSRWAYLGGISGLNQGSSSYKYMQNCLNYGTIIHNGTAKYLIIGGIVSKSSYIYIENCVSAGKIATPTKASVYNYIGGIMGDVYSSTCINYCYYTSDVNVSGIYGHVVYTPSITGTPDTPTGVDSDLLGKLNSNATSCNWSKWLLNTNNAAVTFKMSDNKELSFSSQIILIPNPVKEGNNFLFWCKDAECTEKFETELVSGTTNLYAAWVNNTVTFDFDNGTTVNETFTYNTSVEYPQNEDMKKEGYIFSGWDKSDIVHMPAQNITITALWKANNYIVTFNANGGNLSATSMVVTFNSTYGPLPDNVTRTGHTFTGWFTDNNMSVKSETIVSIADNHTLQAHWEETTNHVEIVFNTKDLSREDVEELVKKYTDANFTITRFEEESGEIRVIIKFINNEEAARFIRNANELSRVDGDNLIKRIGFVPDSDASFSLLLYPTLFLTSLL